MSGQHRRTTDRPRQSLRHCGRLLLTIVAADAAVWGVLLLTGWKS